MSRKADIDLSEGMPYSNEAEKFLLASVMIDGTRFPEVAALGVEDFGSNANRVIFARLKDLAERGDKIGRVELAEELLRHKELETVNGISGLLALEDGMPALRDLASYIRLVKDNTARRRIAVAAQHMMNRALRAEESPDVVLAGADESFRAISEGRQDASGGLMGAGEFIGAFPGGWNAFATPAERENGLRTGLRRFDEMTGGFRGGELIILAARPGVGKSAAALGMAWHVATVHNEPVAIFSLEMSRESLLLRALCSVARIDSHRLRLGYMNDGEMAKIRDARNRLVDAPIYIDDSSNIGLMDIHAKIRRWEHTNKRKIGLVVIDYLQLMAAHAGGRRDENETAQLRRITRGLKLMAKELDTPFLVLSQLSRASEARTGDKRPQLSDLRQSGSIEEDADVVAFLFRESMYKPDREDLRGLAELILSKQRGGPCGTIPLVFLAAMTRFENMAEDVGEMPTEETRLPYAE